MQHPCSQLLQPAQSRSRITHYQRHGFQCVQAVGMIIIRRPYPCTLNTGGSRIL